MRDRLLSFLGIARKAGRLVMGRDAVLEALKEEKAALVLLLEDVRSKEKVRAAAGKTPVLELENTMEEMEAVIGKRVGILALTDAGFANRVLELHGERTESGPAASNEIRTETGRNQRYDD